MEQDVDKTGYVALSSALFLGLLFLALTVLFLQLLFLLL